MSDEAEPPPRPPGVTCPNCGARARWEANPHRPFCSLPCRLIDLGAWLDERYRIGVEGPEPPAGRDDVP